MSATTKPTPRRRIVALATAATMLGVAGLGTNALFTDTEVVQDNSFAAGTLDLSIGDQTRSVQATDMAPGDVEWASVELVNSGTIGLQYTFTVSVSGGDSPALAQVLEARTLAGATTCDELGSASAATLLDANGFPTPDSAHTSPDTRLLAVGEAETLCLRVALPLGATDVYQGATSTLTWTFHAEQQTAPETAQAGRLAMTYDTTAPLCTTDATIQLPLSPADADGTIDWGDGTVTDVDDGVIHTYPEHGTYHVEFEGTAATINSKPLTYYQRRCLTSVDAWDDNLGLTSLNGAFWSAANLTTVPETLPSTVVDVRSAFNGASLFNSDVSGWDVSEMTSLSEMFMAASSFDGDLSGWDVSNVTDFYRTFREATVFNGDLSGWDVSNATNVTEMFDRARAFNADITGWKFERPVSMGYFLSNASSFDQDLSGWDVSKVTSLAAALPAVYPFDLSGWDVSNVRDFSNLCTSDKCSWDISGWDVSSAQTMYCMFCYTNTFNQDLSNWDTGNVYSMVQTFYEAKAFNGDLSRWDTKNVQSMNYMFYNASSFTSDLSNWDVGKVTDMAGMFNNAPLFTSDLSRWNVENVTTTLRMFYNASSFTSDLSGWRPAKLMNLEWMFGNAISFNSDLSGWTIPAGAKRSYYDSGSTSWTLPRPTFL